MTILRIATLGTIFIIGLASAQDEAENAEFRKTLCADKGPGEWFRLTNEDCRNVIQCTEAGLQALKCPHGLSFDLNLQTCQWNDQVKNCAEKVKKKKAKPLLETVEPLCQENFLACGDGTCMDRTLFCDGKPDCADDSDENSCDINSDPNSAPRCNEIECSLPDCYCYTNEAKLDEGGPRPHKQFINNIKDIPQMIMITFDDAINYNNMDLYDLIFRDRYNPNDCTIKSTFFVSHKYTNYSAVQEMHRLGHEIAVHSISHNDTESFWTHATEDQWEQEMAGARVIIDRFANITDNSVIGVRAPYLRVGGNNQFKMMENNAFLYDSTITAPLQDVPLWPYTLYYRMPHSCHGNVQKCPTRSFAVWEMVMNEMDRRENTVDEPLPGCAMVDSCFSSKPSDIQFKNFLDNNFNRHYSSNRAPLSLGFHSAFLKNDPKILDAFLLWLDEILATHEDVYFVTMTQVIQWMQDPRPVSQLKNYETWRDKCAIQPGNPFCYSGTNCELNTDELPGETLRLNTCMRCPNRYPWLKDPLGEGYF